MASIEWLRKTPADDGADAHGMHHARTVAPRGPERSARVAAVARLRRHHGPAIANPAARERQAEPRRTPRGPFGALFGLLLAGTEFTYILEDMR